MGRVNCLAKEHSAMARLGLEPRSLDLEFCAEHQSFACPKPNLKTVVVSVDIVVFYRSLFQSDF